MPNDNPPQLQDVRRADDAETENEQKQPQQQPLRPAMVLGRRRSDAEGKNETDNSSVRGTGSKGMRPPW